VGSFLLKLLDDLDFVAGKVLFIEEVNVLNATVIKDKIMDVVIVDFASFIGNAVARLI
jgi:hypothetical protein